VTSRLQLAQISEESESRRFFQQSGTMAPNGAIIRCRMETKEMVSLITIRFWSRDAELQQLAELHGLNDLNGLTCGAYIQLGKYRFDIRSEAVQSSMFGVLERLCTVIGVLPHLSRSQLSIIL